MDDSPSELKEKLTAMTVVQLRKLLSKKGLSHTGNKAELIRKLNSSMNETEDSSALDIDSALLDEKTVKDSEESFFNDDILLKDDQLVLSSPEKFDSQDECKSLKNLIKNPSSSVDLCTSDAAKPLKKRLLVETSSQPLTAKKRFVIKRDNIPTPKLIKKPEQNDEVESNPSIAQIQPWEKLSDLEKHGLSDYKCSSDNKNLATSTDSSDKHVKITFQNSELAGEKSPESHQNKLQARAKRFNLISFNSSNTVSSLSQKSDSELETKKKPQFDEKLENRAKRFNLESTDLSSTSSSTKSNITESVSKSMRLLQPDKVPDLDVLLKRGKRFGESVSTVVIKAEQKQKLLDRKSKFESTTILANEESVETKKKRAERFGM